MIRHSSILKRRSRKRVNKAFDLQLTSMLDILVIILVFLLKSSTASTTQFATVQGIKIPLSVSPDVPPDSLHLIVTPEALTFENEEIMRFVITPAEGQDAAAAAQDDHVNYQFNPQDLSEGGRLVRPLYDALVKARERSELLRAQSQARDEEGKPLPFDGVLAIQADKRISYDTLRRLMYTAGAAGYKVFRFLALKKE